MQKSHVFGVACFGLFLISIFGAYEFSKPTGKMSAAGINEPAPTLTWASMFGYIASGSFVAGVATFWKSAQPIVSSVVHQFSPGTAVPGTLSDGTTKDLEFVLASIAYAVKRDDKSAQRRAVLAAVTEMGDMPEMQSQPVSDALHTLLTAAASAWTESTITIK